MLFRDRSGVLWIATQNGVERYAAGRLTRLGTGGMIAGDLVQPFAQSSTGPMFLLTSSGLFEANGSATQRVELPASLGAPVAVYAEAAGRVWLGTTRGLVALQNTAHGWVAEGDLLPTASPVTVMLGDRRGSLWIGTRRNGLYRWNAGRIEHWSTGQGLADDGVRTLFFDDEGDLWISTLSGGLSRWREGSFVAYRRMEGFPAAYVSTAFADSRGTLWLGSWTRACFACEMKSWKPSIGPGV